MKKGVCVAIGSGLGGAARFALDELIVISLVFPISTFIANISGSFLIGYLAGRWSGGPSSSKWHFWITGFCGGFTTFSAFSWQLLDLLADGHGQMAGIYAAASIGIGIICVYVGMSLSIAAKRKEAR